VRAVFDGFPGFSKKVSPELLPLDLNIPGAQDWSMAKGDIPGGMTFKLDISAMQKWLAAWQRYPKVAGKWASTMLNDMAFEFKNRFPEVIASRYTIRDKKFIKKTIWIDRARPRSHMADIAATVGTWRGEDMHRFSGFTEELTGSPDSWSKHNRTILPAGRRGGDFGGKSFDWARMHPNQNIPSITDPVLQNISEDRRFAAMIDMMTRGKMAHSPSNVFILEGGKYKPGLYRFKGGKLPDREQFKKGNKRRVAGKGKVQRIQAFSDKPLLPPMWDWRTLTMEKVQEKFTPDYMWDNYIERVFMGITPKEFFKGGK
jgi:hypothetical protein